MNINEFYIIMRSPYCEITSSTHGKRAAQTAGVASGLFYIIGIFPFIVREDCIHQIFFVCHTVLMLDAFISKCKGEFRGLTIMIWVLLAGLITVQGQNTDTFTGFFF